MSEEFTPEKNVIEPQAPELPKDQKSFDEELLKLIENEKLEELLDFIDKNKKQEYVISEKIKDKIMEIFVYHLMGLNIKEDPDDSKIRTLIEKINLLFDWKIDYSVKYIKERFTKIIFDAYQQSEEQRKLNPKFPLISKIIEENIKNNLTGQNPIEAADEIIKIWGISRDEVGKILKKPEMISIIVFNLIESLSRLKSTSITHSSSEIYFDLIKKYHLENEVKNEELTKTAQEAFEYLLKNCKKQIKKHRQYNEEYDELLKIIQNNNILGINKNFINEPATQETAKIIFEESLNTILTESKTKESVEIAKFFGFEKSYLQLQAEAQLKRKLGYFSIISGVIELIKELELSNSFIDTPEIRELAIKAIEYRLIDSNIIVEEIINDIRESCNISDEIIKEKAEKAIINRLLSTKLNFGGISAIIKNKKSLLIDDDFLKSDKIRNLYLQILPKILGTKISEIAKYVILKEEFGLTLADIKSEENILLIDDSASIRISQNEFEHALKLLDIFEFSTEKQKGIFLDVFSGAINYRKWRQISDILENINSIPKIGIQTLEDEFYFSDYREKINVMNSEIYLKYIELRKLDDQKIVENFVRLVNSYINKLNQPTKPIDEEMRKSDYYLGCSKHVYPKGNYSSHEENKKCEEHPEFFTEETPDLGKDGNNETGYILRLTGLKGYEYKGNEDDRKTTQKLIADYSQRIETIHNFVQHSGSNNEKLQQDFSVFIDKFLENVDFIPQDLKEKLTIHEKMTAVLLQSLINFKTQRPVKPIEDIRIQDLLILYRYAYLEDMNAYVQMTRDNIERQKDELSKEFLLLSQLNVIYGENYKHILNNELAVVLKNSVHIEEIDKLFHQQFGNNKQLSKEELKFKNKFSESLKQSIIDNPKILEDQKPEKISREIFRKFRILEDKTRQSEWEQVLENEIKTNKELIKLINEKNPNQLFDFLNSFKQSFLGNDKTQNQEQITDIISNSFSRDYNQISQELAKYQPILEEVKKETKKGEIEVRKSAKERIVKGFFSPITKETSNARMSAFLCLAGNHEMSRNPNYLEFVLYDEETKRCSGLTMLLKIEQDNKKYLWVGPNPSEDLLSKVSYQECYDQIKRYIIEFAKINEYDGIVTTQVKQIHGNCTNRDNNFVEIIKDSILKENGSYKTIDFKKPHQLAEGYEYQNCSVIWENEELINKNKQELK